MLSVEQALHNLQQTVPGKPGTETVDLEHAHRRVLAEAPVATTDIPPADNSAMDGFAVAYNDLHPGTPVTLPVSARQPAGQAPMPLQPGTAVRIFTGAELPPGADTVIIQEDCRYDTKQVCINVAPEAGANVRGQGEDMRKGQVLLEPGRRLQAADIALLAAGGIGRVTVYRRLTAALLITGDELVQPGEPLPAGRIYDSNTPMLRALLENMGFETAPYHVPDTAEDTIAILRQSATADVIISTGGVSVGEEDHIGNALATLGRTAFWKIAMKPGKPFLFGEVNSTPLFGLPGNPVSALVTFCIFARPFLSAMQGGEFVKPRHWPVKAGFNMTRTSPRQQFLRATLVQEDDHGELTAVPLGRQGSAALDSLSQADALVVIPPEKVISENDPVEVILLAELLSL